MIIEATFIILGFMLLILGLCELIHIITLAVISKAGNPEFITLIFLKPEKYLSQLMQANEQRRWQGEDFTSRIIAVSDALSLEEMSEAQNYCKRSGIFLCSKENLQDFY
ncbi:MAG: hypothetical protein PUF48_03510 [Oscillospiraceae bacterium]|nr:hypothetical protein [Oscillospiraceae bacterium]